MNEILDYLIQIILIICLLVFIDYLSIVRKIKVLEEKNAKIIEHFSLGSILSQIGDGITAGFKAMGTVADFIVPGLLNIFNFLTGMIDSVTKYAG
jgi:hypothetical protein